MSIQFRVLGPVEVSRDGKSSKLGASMTALLAAMLTSPNLVIPATSLIDWIWGDRLPDHPEAALHNVVSRARRLVGEGTIRTHPWGYQIRADPVSLDLLRFNDLRVRAGRARTAGDITTAALALDEAVALWRQPLLGNVGSPALRGELVPDLTERFLESAEERARLHLRLGHPDVVIRDLPKVIRTHRYREGAAGMLMVALARRGRQAEALAICQDLRQALREDLGISPGAEVQGIFERILRGDPNLPWPPERGGTR